MAAVNDFLELGKRATEDEAAVTRVVDPACRENDKAVRFARAGSPAVKDLKLAAAAKIFLSTCKRPPVHSGYFPPCSTFTLAGSGFSSGR